MIDPIPGWSWDLRASGVILEGPAGRICYVETVRPARRLVDLVEATEPRGWSSTTPPAIERLLTRENEYAALALIDGELSGRPARRAVGAIWLDDACALVDGLAVGDEEREPIATIVGELVRSDSHLRGVRRRRFVYRPPPGWSGLLLPPHNAYWFPSDYPRGGVYAAAFAAQPRHAFPAGARSFVEGVRLLSGARQAVARSDALVSSARGLSGRQIEAQVSGLGVPTRRIFVILEDSRYLYPFAFEAPAARAEELQPVIRQVVESVEPIPSGQPAKVSPVWDD